MTAKPSVRTDERGESLPLALIALAIGSLLIVPLLMRVSSGLHITTRAEGTIHAQYAGDAAVEYALWALTHDAELRNALVASPGAAQTLAVPEAVNGTVASLRLVAVETAELEGDGGTAKLPYAVFGNNTSRTNTVVMSGSGHRVIGDVHSNNQIRITGSGHSVEGLVTYSGDISVVGAGNYFIPGPPDNPRPDGVRGFPLTWDIADLAPGGALAEQAGALYTVHEGDWHLSGSAVVVPPGLHYCTGNVYISGSGIVGEGVTIVALGTITVSGSGMQFTPHVPGLTFYSALESSGNAISISGSGNTGGTSYAPKGTISLTGSGGTIVGAFLGDRVAIDGSGATIQLADVTLPTAGSETCGVYDVESTADTTRTLVRATDCDPQGLQILAWRID